MRSLAFAASLASVAAAGAAAGGYSAAAHDPAPVPAPVVIERAAPPAPAPVVIRYTLSLPEMHVRAPVERFEELKTHRATLTGADRIVERALAAAEAGDHGRARALLARAFALEPDHALGHLLAGVMDQEEKGLAAARAEYGRYLFAAPLGPYAGDVRHVLSGPLKNVHVQEVASK